MPQWIQPSPDYGLDCALATWPPPWRPLGPGDRLAIAWYLMWPSVDACGYG